VSNPLIEPGRRLVIAHRGASSEAPENTLEAFRLGIAQGADALEMDVRLTRDGHLAVIALDLDHFKRVNDRYGHDIGDLVLQKLSDTIRGQTREHDVFARTGGEEFVIVVTGPEARNAQQLAERIRTALATMRLDSPAPPVRVTASLGVAVSARSMPLSMLMRGADEALYTAKRAGRDCVVTHTL